MTDLTDRLDELAGEATAGLEIKHPATSSGRPLHRVIAVVAAAAAMVGLVIGGVFLASRDSKPITVTTANGDSGRAGRPAILDRPATDSDRFPDHFLGGTMYGLDAGSLRAGPSIDGFTMYVATTHGDRDICLWILPDTTEGWAQAGAGSSCASLASLATTGATAVGLSGDGVSFLAGVTSPDVLDITAAGGLSAFDNGAFIASGVDDLDAIGLVRSTQRTALVAACAALGPLVETYQNLAGLSAAETVALVEAGQATGEPTFSALAEMMVPAASIGLSAPEDLTDELAALVAAAVTQCERQGVPGWLVIYQPPASPRASSVGIAVDLDSYGQRQDLEPTTAVPSTPPTGPGLGPITRTALQGTDVTVFWWTEHPQPVTCLWAQIPGRSSGGCVGGLPAISSVRIHDGTDNQPDGLHVRTQRANPEAAYATITAGDTTYVQEIRADTIAFATPSPAGTITQYRSDGTPLTPSG